MAIGVIKFTYRQRKVLKTVFSALCIVEICLALLITIATSYIYFEVNPILFSEKSEVGFVFIVIGMYSFQVALHYIIGLRIGHKCFNHAEKKSTRSLLFLWLCAGLFFLINMLILVAMSNKVGYHINRSLAYSLRFGMENYLENGKWKTFIDKLQYKLSCCGIDGYKDWHEIRWLNSYHINENNDFAKKFLNADFKSYFVNPWSCCRLDFPLQCLHDPFQQQASSQVWENEPKVVSDSLNTEGCLDVIQKPIGLSLMFCTLITIIIIVFNLLIFIISRWLYTSTRNALILEDPEGLAPGWIFGRGDCGYRRGKTLYDIMTAIEGYEMKIKKESKDDVNDTAQEKVINNQLYSAQDKQAVKQWKQHTSRRWEENVTDNEYHFA